MSNNFIIKAVLLCVVLIQTTIGFGQNLIGKVLLKESKAGVPFASVYLPDLGIGTVTDSVGYFEFKNKLLVKEDLTL